MGIISLCGVVLVLFASSFCYGDDQKTVLEVVGFGECADCAETNIKASEAFSGLHVTIDCKTSNGEFKTRGVGELDQEGKFKVSLPQELILEHGKLKEECFAQLHSASSTPCPAHNNLESSKIIFKTKTNDKHTFNTAGKLIFSSKTCACHHFMWPPLPKLPPHPWFKKKPFPKFGHHPPKDLPPKPIPPPVDVEPLPPPVEKPEPIPPPVEKPEPLPPPVVEKPEPLPPPEVKPEPIPPTVPIHKPIKLPPFHHHHHPIFKKPLPPPVEKPEPIPPPVEKPKPLPPPVVEKPKPLPPPEVKPEPIPPTVPIHKPIKLPPFHHHHHPIFKKPLPPPSPIEKPLLVPPRLELEDHPPIFKKPFDHPFFTVHKPKPPVMKMLPPFPFHKPCPPLVIPKIPPKYFHHPKFGSLPPDSTHP